MKVDLEKLRVGLTGVTQDFVIGLPTKDGRSMKEQKVVTSDVLAAIIDWGCGYVRTITDSAGGQYEIIVKKKAQCAIDSTCSTTVPTT